LTRNDYSDIVDRRLMGGAGNRERLKIGKWVGPRGVHTKPN